MTDARVSRASAEALLSNTPDLRVSRALVEVLMAQPPTILTSRHMVEALHSPAPTVTGYPGVVLSDVPLAYYRLDEAIRGTTDASSNFSGEGPANAFDGNAGSYWTTAATQSGWLRFQCSRSLVVTSYQIRRRDDIPNRNVKTWTFEGSTDGASWTVLDTQTNITWPTASETKTFTFTNSTAYSWYRLNVSANNGDTYLSVAELVVSGVESRMLDSSGNGRHGVYEGPVASAPGLVVGDSDTAISLTTSISRGVVATATWMDSASITVEALVRPTGLVGGIVDRDAGGTRSWQWRFAAGGKIEHILWTTTTSVFVTTSSTALVAGKTYIIGWTFDGAAIRLYLNGVQDAVATVGGTMKAANDRITVGRGDQNSQYTGVIDEVAIYGSALSSARMLAHYNAALPVGVATVGAPTVSVQMKFPDGTWRVAVHR